MLDKFDNMLASVQDFAELEALARAQFNTIIKLNSEINVLQEKNQQLELLLKQGFEQKEQNFKDFQNVEDAEVICRTQLKILRDKALVTELTKEEAVRTQIYTDILEKIEAKKLKDPKDVTPVEENELLALVKGNG